jgi:cellulose synthase (UDP-forming)
MKLLYGKSPHGGVKGCILFPLFLIFHVIFADNVQQTDAMNALWSLYKFNYLEDGKVLSRDEGNVTTSEGQSYAMLRSVWANDPQTFESVWSWTRRNLQVRDDRLFAWKYNGHVLDYNTATDADVDIALALILASRKFGEKSYYHEALKVIRDIWKTEVVQSAGDNYLTAGNWAPHERYPTIHTAYLAPYAYSVFAEVDKSHPWNDLVKSSYAILHWIYDTEQLQLPPEIVYLNKKTGKLLLGRPGFSDKPRFSYDAFPLYWRLAVDERWWGRSEQGLRKKMLKFFSAEWKKQGKFLDTYTPEGTRNSDYEGLPLYATVHALASLESETLAKALGTRLAAVWKDALKDQSTPYYLHNWLWFDKALELKMVRNYRESFDFLIPLDYKNFRGHFPWTLFFLALVLYFLWRIEKFKYRRHAKIGFIILALIICARYLLFRLCSTLNFTEPVGPFISITLLIAELYCFSTVLLLMVQVGFNAEKRRKPAEKDPSFAPTVDVFIPIYSESLEILEKTVVAALNMTYPNKKVHVCDDSHKDEVRELCTLLGVHYIKGPKKHAKAGNLNNAFTVTGSELLVVFDTDHIPTNAFLQETVPYFKDLKVGVVQTPHHFFNADIFQRAFGKERVVPNENDAFNHGILGGRDCWGGTFFVGSGAVFRRTAIEEIGGFKLLSITEDIHTCQHLHSRGWKSVFVDKDLVAGLAAENLSSYLIQRRRWMLGGLQIFFKDNPLLLKGLPLRHRLGYFASCYSFLSPITKVIFWVTPLYYLLFHWHPIRADVTVLFAYLIPYMVVLPMINAALIPNWPRALWGDAYENIIAFQMFRSMFDLFLPKNMGFKVTPKGITSERRTFDYSSSKLTLLAVGIGLFAVCKGFFEFFFFGIEKDAYFFNLGWALYSLFLLCSALLIAWERPQRRVQDRVFHPFKCLVNDGNNPFPATTLDISLTGVAFSIKTGPALPEKAILEFGEGINIPANIVYRENVSRAALRCGYRFDTIDQDLRKRLFLMIFGSAQTWEKAHAIRPKFAPIMAYHYFEGMIRCFMPRRTTRRMYPRYGRFEPAMLVLDKQYLRCIIYNRSAKGLGVIVVGKTKPHATQWGLRTGNGGRFLHHVHTKNILPHIWKIGFIVPAVPLASVVLRQKQYEPIVL